MSRPTFPRFRRELSTGLAMMALLGAAGCATEVDSAASGASVVESTPASSSTSTPPTSAPTTLATVPAPTMPEYTIDSTSTTTEPPAPTTSSSTTTTLAAPVVGGFACTQAGQAPSTWEVRPPSDIPPPEVPAGWTSAVVGRSVQGRGIEVLVHPAAEPRRRVLVIGGLHGNEPVTPPAVRGLLEAEIADDVEVWLVPESNPDASAAGVRCNANGVDLNRNFAWDWRAEDGGPSPLSEPETRTLAQLVDGLRPDVVVWVHQPLGYVSAVGETPSALEEAWAAAAGLPVRVDVTQHGGGESWSAFAAGVPSMLIEVEGWDATPDIVRAHVAGFEAMLAALG